MKKSHIFHKGVDRKKVLFHFGSMKTGLRNSLSGGKGHHTREYWVNKPHILFDKGAIAHDEISLGSLDVEGPRNGMWEIEENTSRPDSGRKGV